MYTLKLLYKLAINVPIGSSKIAINSLTCRKPYQLAKEMISNLTWESLQGMVNLFIYALSESTRNISDLRLV